MRRGYRQSSQELTTSPVRSVAVALLLATVAASACSVGAPSSAPVSGGPVGHLVGDFEPIEVDVESEAKAYNDGHVYEFVVDETGYVQTPSVLPAGSVIVTLTYIGAAPAPHSLVFSGVNDDQPVVAVDTPGSNNGSVRLPAGRLTFFDGAPGNRSKGFVGTVSTVGQARPAAAGTARADAHWVAEGLTFVSAPRAAVPADVPINLELTVNDALPHSIALVQVRSGQPLVAVDGPGTNRRSLSLPSGTYVYFCAVPGHREAGMEGLLRVE